MVKTNHLRSNMKNIKQIREEFNNIEGPIVEDHEFSMARSELKSIIDNAQHLLGLLKGEGDLEAWMQSKITKAADYLTSVHDNIASGESDIKEDHDEKEAEKASFDKKIPFMIMLKRKSIRQFPNNQTVALYYAQNIDRYISIPFGKKAETVIAEAKDKSLDAFVKAHIAKGGTIQTEKGKKIGGQEALDYLSKKPAKPQIQKAEPVATPASKPVPHTGTDDTDTDKPPKTPKPPIPLHHVQKYIKLMANDNHREAKEFARSLHAEHGKKAVRQMKNDAEPHIEKAKFQKTKSIRNVTGAIHQVSGGDPAATIGGLAGVGLGAYYMAKTGISVGNVSSMIGGGLMLGSLMEGAAFLGPWGIGIALAGGIASSVFGW